MECGILHCTLRFVINDIQLNPVSESEYWNCSWIIICCSGSVTFESKMHATEKTPLRSHRTLKYDPLQVQSDLEVDILDSGDSTTVYLIDTDAKSTRNSRVARIVATIAVVFSASLIFLSFSEGGSKPNPSSNVPKTQPGKPWTVYPIHSPHKPTPPALPIEGAAWSAIAQPLSILDPESLGFLAIDRPPISMPGPIFGELLEKNVALPTNSWCENLFLGESTTESTNRVYQVPYVIDTEVHGNASTQGVETHPAHVQANERMVEVWGNRH